MRDRDAASHEMTLMLLYLTSWVEGKPPYAERRSWIGYPFTVIDGLSEAGLLEHSRGNKSAYLTPAGEKEAIRLLGEYGVALEDGPEDGNDIS